MWCAEEKDIISMAILKEGKRANSACKRISLALQNAKAINETTTIKSPCKLVSSLRRRLINLQEPEAICLI
jgi:hypothetical protein